MMNLLWAPSLFLLSAGLLHVASPKQDGSINAIIDRTLNLACLLKANSSGLLETYLSRQGSPFTGPGFNVPRLRYSGVPAAAISFLEWRILSDVDRLDKNYMAYTIFSEFLQLVWDDQLELNPTEDELLDMLKVTRLHVQGLLNNLTTIMSVLGVPPSPVSDPLTLEVVKTNTFEKKIRGYVVCYSYKQWVDRTVRDFTLLVKKYPI